MTTERAWSRIGLLSGVCVVVVAAAWGVGQPAAVAAPRAAGVVGEPSAAGAWSGAIKLPGQGLNVSVMLKEEGGAWTGTIDIPQQGARGLGLADVAVDGRRVTFAIRGVPGAPTFEGTIEGSKLAGTFTQSGMSFPFELERGELERPRRPQEPSPPFPYEVEEVRATNGEVALAGTLTRPRGEGPFPAVVLISGSGPQDRNEEIFDHKPFWILADHLTRAGVVVVRYDDRGVGASTGRFAGSTTKDFAGDAEAWVGFLKGRPEVGAVGLIGHSEGGLIAPIVAARNADVAFIVMLAGTGVPGREILVEQNRAIALASGAPAEMADEIARRAGALFEAVERGAPEAEARRLMRDLVTAQAGPGGAGVPEEAMEEVLGAQLRSLDEPWFRQFLTLDPREYLRRVRVPVLALNGSKDVQVVPSQNLPEIERALREGGNGEVTVREIPDLNHLFQRAQTGSVAEYGSIEETMNPAALEAVSGWIVERFGAGKDGR